MDRRDFLTAAAGGLAATATSGLFATRAFAAEGELNSDLIITDTRALKQLQVVVDAAFRCVAAGVSCVQHCQEQLVKGQAKEFADCSFMAHQMVPICQNIGTLAAYKAKAIADFLDGCIKACETCRVACRAHEAHFAHGMHQECKRCMEACIACRDACRELKSLL